MTIMMPDHPDWEEFLDLLSGSEGCNFREVRGEVVFDCDSSMDRPYARRILEKYFPDIDIEETLEVFELHGGYCDCEILFNVDPQMPEKGE
jgi:hypothetical protein